MTSDLPPAASSNTGEPKASSPRWIGDLWILAAITLVFMGISRWQYSGHQRFVCVNRGQVVYSASTTKAQAIKLRDVMDQMGGFTGNQLITLKLDRIDDRHELSLFVDQEQFESLTPVGIASLNATVKKICVAAFGDEPVTVRLTDPYLNPHTELLSLPDAPTTDK